MGETVRPCHTGAKGPPDTRPAADSVIDCGWGRLIFGHTFASQERAGRGPALPKAPGHRDIAF